MIELLQYSFFVNALISSILVGILGGFIGTYIVTRRLVFIAGGLAHASLGGVGLCALCSAPPILGASIFSLLSAAGVKRISQTLAIKEDAAIAMIWAFGVSVGIICAFHAPEFLPDLPNYIFGNVLLSTSSDIMFLAVLTLISTVFFIRYLPQIATIAFDKEFARSIRIPVEYFENILMVLVALSVVAILRAMGIVLAISLLSIPHITASTFARKFSHTIGYSIIITIIDCLLGLYLSYHFNIPSGATIVFVAVVIYALSKTIKVVSTRLVNRSVVSHQHTTD